MRKRGMPTYNLEHPQNIQDQVIHAAKLVVLAHLHLRMARSPNPTIISSHPLAGTSHMT